MVRKVALLVAALAAALTLVVPSSAAARECIGVPGVFNYCPGRHCGDIQPCDVTQR